MIVVIADDLSGAAEIAGIAWSHGLGTEILTDLSLTKEPELLVIDSDTRSQSAADASEKISRLGIELSGFKVNWLYKKVDSVLRGHVIDEIESLMISLNKNKVLLIPANPSKGRIITKEKYYIDGQLLHTTDFAQDPEFPRTTSNIFGLLGSPKEYKLKFMTKTNAVHKEGIIIAEAISDEDLQYWSEQVDASVIAAGGSDFFKNLLRYKGYKVKKGKIQRYSTENENRLVVLGSTSNLSKKQLHKLYDLDMKVCPVPCTMINEESLTELCLDTWTNDIIRSFKACKTVVCAINQAVINQPGFAQKLTNFIASMVESVYNTITVDEMIIEGGTTASQIIRRFGWKRLIPTSEFTSGVVAMTVGEQVGLTVIIKPGSYPWPDEIWELN